MRRWGYGSRVGMARGERLRRFGVEMDCETGDSSIRVDWWRWTGRLIATSTVSDSNLLQAVVPNGFGHASFVERYPC
mgnify:CR=1 FL=1